MAADRQERPDRIFAYVVLVCPAPGPDELAGRSYRDILDGFVEAERSGADERSMWPFGWGSRMRRKAPLQITGIWDARQDLLRLLGPASVRIDHPAVYGGSVLYFPAPCSFAAIPAVTKDAVRLASVVASSVELARRRDLGEGILFVGGWAWGAGDAELPAEQQVTLMAAGFTHVDRRVP